MRMNMNLNLRRIPLQHAYNTRDLGGYPTAGGRCTRWGMLYRSDALAELSSEDWQMLESRRVRTILDLRSAPETQRAPIRVPDSMSYVHLSLMPELDQMTSAPQAASANPILQSMKLDYSRTLFAGIPACARILDLFLAQADTGSTLFLCSAGKDRTGIVAAMVLYLCGVTREDIAVDYMVSSLYNTNGINRKLQSLPPELLQRIPDRRILEECLASRPETILTLLDDMDARNFRELLAQAGFSAEKQKLLKETFTEA